LNYTRKPKNCSIITCDCQVVFRNFLGNYFKNFEKTAAAGAAVLFKTQLR